MEMLRMHLKMLNNKEVIIYIGQNANTTAQKCTKSQQEVIGRVTKDANKKVTFIPFRLF